MLVSKGEEDGGSAPPHSDRSQRDVQEVARVLTGWTVARQGRLRGQFIFDEDAHDFGEKQILGRTFPAGRGEAEVAELLDLLAAGKIKPLVAERIPLLEAASAHELLERGGYAGKFVLVAGT